MDHEWNSVARSILGALFDHMREYKIETSSNSITAKATASRAQTGEYRTLWLDRETGIITHKRFDMQCLFDDVVGHLSRFDDGEYTLDIPKRLGVSPVHRWFFWDDYYCLNTVPPKTDLTIKCSSCWMSKLKPAKSVSDLLPRLSQSETLGKLMDILICQNSHCGQYHAIYLDLARNGQSFSLLSRRMDITAAELGSQRLELMSALNMACSFPGVIYCIVADYIESAPGSCIAGKSKRVVVDESLELTYEFIGDAIQGPNVRLLCPLFLIPHPPVL